MSNITPRLMLAAAFCYSPVPAFAQGSLTVPNFSFETPALGLGNNTTENPSNWVLSATVQGGVYNPTDDAYPGATTGPLPAPALGDQLAYINITASGPTPASLTTAAPTGVAGANTVYTLTVAVGRRVNVAADERFRIALLLDGSPVSAAVLSGTSIPAGTFTDLTTTYTSPSAGGNLDVRLTYEADGEVVGISQANFDNIRVGVAPVPEPATCLAAAAVGLATDAALRSRRHGRGHPRYPAPTPPTT
jgi:hypothetical protein